MLLSTLRRWAGDAASPESCGACRIAWLLLNPRRGGAFVEHALLIGLIAASGAYGLSSLAGDLRAALLKQQEALERAADQDDNGNCGNPTPGAFQGRSPCAP